MKLVSILCSLLLFAGCSSSAKKPANVNYTVFTMTNAPVVGTTMSGQEIKLGGFSGLQFLEAKNGKLYFQTITDRGPNAPTVGKDRPFLLPEYSPMLVKLAADPKTAALTSETQIKLKKKDGTPLTGLAHSREEENPLDIFGLINSIDIDGMDTEGVVADVEGGWWVAEEYAPSLAFFDESGKLQRKLTPDNEIPRQYKNRRPNRGFEAVAKNGSKLYGFLQSPINKETDHSLIVEMDLNDSRTSAEYLYVFEKGNDKIGDAVHVRDNSLLVIEQNGRTDEKAQKAVYLIKLGQSDQPVQKTLVVDLAQTAFKTKEKIEGLAYIPGRGIALTYDNDFQISGATDFETGKTPLNNENNQVMIIDLNLDGLL